MTVIDVTSSELTPELLDLFEHEKVIEQGLASFIDVGLSLLAIRDGKKYKHSGYATFEHYCQKRWSIGVSHGKRLMSAAGIARDLERAPMGAVLPEHERQVRPLVAVPPLERPEVWAEAVKSADGGQPTAKQVEAVVAKRQPPKKDHPAPFSDPILAKIAAHLPTEGVVLDPFAGTGRVHELATEGRSTIGVEIEEEWADKHPDTIHGDALRLGEHVGKHTVDAIATSPTYGNRMADHHTATDDSVRLTYKHTLGHELDANNSGAMQWGDEYRAFHLSAWREALRALKPGGTFTLNIKNHIRAGEIQRVAEWHIQTLMVDLELDLVALDVVPTKGLMAGANAATRVDHELIVTFRKGTHDE